MVTDILKLSASVGRIIAEEIDSPKLENMLYNKEFATIAEKSYKL